jgi:hypothetical protein
LEQLTIDEKRAYIARIDDKAKADGISNKHAARKLGLHEWKYYQFKNDIKRAVIEPKQTRQDAEIYPVKLTISVTEQAYSYLKAEAGDFALEPYIVAQMMLHHAIMKASREKEVIP